MSTMAPAQSRKITWEAHDDAEGFCSTCGTFEILLDPDYGYYTLHAHGDTTESLSESPRFTDIAEAAERLLASGQVAPAQN